jgi:serine/threonine-protein kinase RsbW
LSSAAVQEVTPMYVGTFPGRPDSVRHVRRAVADHLRRHPAVLDDALIIVSELSTNALLHSASAGGSFTVRLEIRSDYLWLECEDSGGPWKLRAAGMNDRMHGLGLVEAIAGQGNVDIEGDDLGRVIWARLGLGQR